MAKERNSTKKMGFPLLESSEEAKDTEKDILLIVILICFTVNILMESLLEFELI